MASRAGRWISSARYPPESLAKLTTALAHLALRDYTPRMTSAEVIAVLRAHRGALRQRGVLRAALFGSTARDEAGPGSDIDIMVELDPEARIDLYDYAGIKRFLAGLFLPPVDVVNRASLKAHVRPAAERDAVYAF